MWFKKKQKTTHHLLLNATIIEYENRCGISNRAIHDPTAFCAHTGTLTLLLIQKKKKYI